MSDTAAETSVPATISPKKRGKASAAKPKKSKTAPSHPKVSEMVTSAITGLKERGGSSLQAIKKYIASHYKVDIERLSPFIKKYLKTAVASGQLVQTKGKGATGSFKLSATGQKTKEKPVKTKKVKKEGTPKKPKTSSVAKKVTKPKKSGDKKKTAPVKKPSAAKKSKPAKSPKKPKVTKPKAPKPKKSPATKKTGPKKTGKK